MSAEFGRERPLPLPGNVERADPAESPRRRSRRRAQTAANRQPRMHLDGLAIGAPLTAAFIGVLVAKGDAVLGDGADGAAGAAGVRSGSSEINLGAIGAAPGLGGLAQGGDGAGSSLGATAEASFDDDEPPAGEASALAEPAAASAEMALAAGRTSAAVGAKAASVAGTTIITGPLGMAEGELDFASSGDDDAAGPTHRLGKTIVGGSGDDVIHGTPYNDRLFGGPGDDIIYGYEGDDLLDGGPGNDRLYGGPGDDELLGGSGRDQLYGGTGDDWLDGGTGDDLLFGEQGRDRLFGGDGDDLVDGGEGADRLSGGSGDDVLVVDNLHDVALEYDRGADGGGVDLLKVASGFADSLPGDVDGVTFAYSDNLGSPLPKGTAAYQHQVGSNIEHIKLYGGDDHDVVGGSGDNEITGNRGDNRLYGADGEDILKGRDGNDRLYGGSGDDLLEGNDGDDILKGRSDADRLYGGSGDDVLDGGSGEDLLYGQGGNDIFRIGLNDSAMDTVFDHEGTNVIEVEDGAGHPIETAVAGDELYIIADKNPIAKVGDFVGNEQAFAGIDDGDGLASIDELMAPNAGRGPALAAGKDHHGGDAHGSGADLLASYLDRPSLRGTSGDDFLTGTSGSDWLRGNAGDDRMVGRLGSDVLEGRDGSDLLEGGADADRYLFRAGESGFDTIRDGEGANVAELRGFGGAEVSARVVGSDLVVIADFVPIFSFEDYANNQDAFAGVQVGNQFIETGDLLGN